MKEVVKIFDGLPIVAVQIAYEVVRVTFKGEDGFKAAMTNSGIRLFGLWCPILGGGQLASSCIELLLRNICKSSEHKARECPYSWLREIDKCTTDQQQHLVDAPMLPSVENISTPVSEENSDLANDTKMTEHSQTELSQTEQSQQNFQKIQAKSSQVLSSIELDP